MVGGLVACAARDHCTEGENAAAVAVTVSAAAVVGCCCCCKVGRRRFTFGCTAASKRAVSLIIALGSDEGIGGAVTTAAAGGGGGVGADGADAFVVAAAGAEVVPLFGGFALLLSALRLRGAGAVEGTGLTAGTSCTLLSRCVTCTSRPKISSLSRCTESTADGRPVGGNEQLTSCFSRVFLRRVSRRKMGGRRTLARNAQ